MKATKFLFGVGVNDSDTPVYKTVSGTLSIDPHYEVWKNMIRRCYDRKYTEVQPTYNQCTVDPDWLFFSVFRVWMKQQDWRGKCLDKDIIDPSNKHYAPDLCCFVTHQVNNLLIDSAGSRGKYPQGVGFETNRYIAKVSVNGKQKYIGRYNTTEMASAAYNANKALVVSAHANREKDPRIAEALWRYVDMFKQRELDAL